MITSSAIHSVRPLVETLHKNGKVVQIADGTPLDGLVTTLWRNISNAKNVRIDGELVDTEATSLDESIRKAGAEKNQAGICEYSDCKASVVAMLVKSVTTMMNNARNVVNPLIVDMVAKVEGDYAQRVRDTAIPLSILPNTFNKFWDNPNIRGALANYETASAKPVSLGGFPVMADESLLWEKIKPGSARLEADMKQYLDDMPEGFLLKVYSMLFSGQNEDLVETSSHISGMLNERNIALTGFLIAQALVAKDPLEGTTVDLTTYRAKLNNYIVELGRQSERYLQRRQREIDSGIMVQKVPHVEVAAGMIPAAIQVNGTVYNNWLSKGGSPEILLGAICLDRETRPEVLLEKGELYAKTWERNVRLFESYYKARKHGHVVEIVRNRMIALVHELDGKEELPAPAPAVIDRIMNIIRNCPQAVVADVPRLITKLICDGIYPHTRAGDVLATIESICETNPDMDVREAALYAAIDLVADFMAEQIITK